MELSEISQEGLRAVLAMSLQATSSTEQVSAQEEAVPSGSRNPTFRNIFEGVLFSRRLILSYQLVLLALLLLFTIRHWTGVFRARSRRRQIRAPTQTCSKGNPVKDRDRGSSSSSSTIVGRYPSPKVAVLDDDGERVPLLTPTKKAPAAWPTIYKVRSILVYQPQSISWVNKVLPSNGTTLTVLAFIGLQVFYVFYNMPLSITMLFVFADRTSLLFVANLPLLYLLAAKNQPIKLLTGYSYESLNIFHRRLGEVMCLMALLHSVGMVGVWYTILRPTSFSLAKFLLSKIILLGIGAFVAYELIYFTSLGSFRQRWYEIFLALHISLQVIALVLVWFHHRNSRPYVGAALAIFLIDRVLYRMALKVRSSQASVKVCEDGGTVTVRTDIILRQKRRFLANLTGAGITNGWKATEHVFLTVPALSRKHIVQAHPFTIASRAPLDGDTVANLKLVVRAQDGFSGDLLKYAKGHSSVQARIDGPYGSQHALHLLQQCDLSVVVAGGSGIAVALPLVSALHTTARFFDLEGCGKNEMQSRTVLIWVIRHKSHAAWVDPAELQILEDNGVEIVMPPPTAENGHPDVASMISSWIRAYDDTLFNGHAKAGIVCSGPDGMNRAVRSTCSSLLAQGRNVDVEVEKFGW